MRFQYATSLTSILCKVPQKIDFPNEMTKLTISFFVTSIHDRFLARNAKTMIPPKYWLQKSAT